MASHPLDAPVASGQPSPWAPPVPAAFELSNGGKVWLVERPELPLVSLRVVVPGGSATDPADHPGLCALADTMLSHGAGARDASAFAEEVERLALSLDVETDETVSVAALETHSERLDTALDLLADAMLRPRFDADEVERVREIRQGEIAQELDDPATVARWASSRLYFGPGHPLGHPALGTEKGIDAVDAAALRASWQRRFASDRAHFVVSGAVTRDALAAALEKRFAGWARAGAPAASVSGPPPVQGGPRLYLVDNPDASQSVLRVLMPGPTATDSSLHAARLGVIALGGTFTSRLNRLLREEKGYTYGARADVLPWPSFGLVVAHTAVRQDVTGDALKDLLDQLAKMDEAVTGDEVAKARGARRTRLVEAMESRGGIAGTYASVASLGLGPDWLAQSMVASEGAGAAAVTAALGPIGLQNAVVVVVGDLDQVRGQVEKAVPGTWEVAPKPE